ncbi:MAG: Crp/Fnr family transcriptional regulator [Prevotella sp.]|nr:Crp/Fnr family transcriptional regulator [Prevotella sp.]
MNLQQLPLFQGIEYAHLQTIIAETRFDFRKADAGEIILAEGDPCGQLLFLLNGSVIATRYAHNHGYSISETHNAPMLIHPEHLFGLRPYSPRTITAKTAVRLMALSKEEALRLSRENLVFCLNLQNTIATQAQKALRQTWQPPPANLRQRIVRFVQDRCTHPAGEKILNITLQQLALELAASRLHVSKELRAMQRDGLVELERAQITIPALEKLREGQ